MEQNDEYCKDQRERNRRSRELASIYTKEKSIKSTSLRLRYAKKWEKRRREKLERSVGFSAKKKKPRRPRLAPFSLQTTAYLGQALGWGRLATEIRKYLG